jgi:ATP-dependent Clp protease ATP-binding subunit ClpC
MFERFTDRARHAVVEAQNVSKEMGHNYIGTEHLLLGALRDPDSEATKLLYALGVSYDVVALHLADYFNGVAIQATPPAHVPFTPRAKKVLELALREALQLNSAYISPEHILLAIIREGDGVGAQVIKKLSHKSLEDMRTAVFQAIADRTVAATAERDEAGSGADDIVEGPEYPLPYVIQPVVVDIHRAVELSVDAAVSAVQRAIERGDTRPPEVLYHRAFEVITTHFKRWADEAVARTT